MEIIVLEKEILSKEKIEDAIPKWVGKAILIKSLKAMFAFSDLGYFHNVVIDGDIFISKEFKILPEFKRLFYLNRFDYILRVNIKLDGCVLPRLISLKDIASGSIGKQSVSLRINENLLILDREDKGFVINNVILFARYKSIVFKKYTALCFLPNNIMKRYLIKKI